MTVVNRLVHAGIYTRDRVYSYRARPNLGGRRRSPLMRGGSTRLCTQRAYRICEGVCTQEGHPIDRFPPQTKEARRGITPYLGVTPHDNVIIRVVFLYFSMRN
jgi:hypothetical protein